MNTTQKLGSNNSKYQQQQYKYVVEAVIMGIIWIFILIVVKRTILKFNEAQVDSQILFHISHFRVSIPECR